MICGDSDVGCVGRLAVLVIVKLAVLLNLLLLVTWHWIKVLPSGMLLMTSLDLLAVVAIDQGNSNFKFN